MPAALFPRTPPLADADPADSRQRILHYFHRTSDRYEQLFEILTCDEAYFEKPIALRHPLIFYLGHTATFFVNKLLLAGLLEERINPRFESMFAIGVDEMAGTTSMKRITTGRRSPRSGPIATGCAQRSTRLSATRR